MKKSNIIKKTVSYILSATMLLTINGGIGVFADSSFSYSDAESLDAEIPSYIETENIDGTEWLVFDSGQDMEWLRNHVLNKEDGGEAGAYYCTHNILLKNDIDMADYNGADNNGKYSGIGYGQEWIGFGGTFDGAGHSIYNLKVYTDQPVGPKGLLFNVTKNATIKNLSVSGNVTANRYIGGLVGRTTGSLTVENVVVNADIKLENGNQNAIGGIIGQCGSGQTVGGDKITIKNTVAVGTYGSATSTNPVGGMIGHVYGGYNVNIENSYSSADLQCQGGNVAGLIAGQGTATLKVANSYYKNTMADTSIIVMSNNADPSPIGPDSSFVDVKAVSDEYMKSDKFVEDLGSAFKADVTPAIAMGYPVPKVMNASELEFSNFEWSGEPKTSYADGEVFDLGTLSVQAVYGTKKMKAQISLSKSEPLTVSDKVITVTATSGAYTESKDFNITVRKLKKLEVTTMPDKVDYYEGQVFDPKGMVVTGTFIDENGDEVKQEVTDYTYSPTTALDASQSYVTISYLNKTIALTINVEERVVDRIAVRQKPLNRLYANDEKPDPKDMIVSVYYKNAPNIPTDLEYSSKLEDGKYTYDWDDNSVTVSYKEKNKVYTDSFNITKLNANAPKVVDGVVQLSTSKDMVWFANQVNSSVCKDINGELLNDIDLSNEELFLPIGYANTSLYGAGTVFSGKFDGRNHKVTVNINDEKLNFAKDKLKDSNLEITANAGYVGGLFGSVNNATIKNISVYGIINVSEKYQKAGGIIANASYETLIKNCKNYVDVNAEETTGVAGISGYCMGTGLIIEESGNYGKIKGDYQVGGITGSGSSATIRKCYNLADISGKGDSVGGLAGSAFTLENCWTRGSVTGANKVGGIIATGIIRGNVQNVVSASDIKASGADAGLCLGVVNKKTAPCVLKNILVTASGDLPLYTETTKSRVKVEGDVSIKTSEELKAKEILETLGDEFTLAHSEAVGNAGYPVLKWQVTDEMHTWDEGTVTKEATTEEEGEKTYKCTDPACDATKTEAIAKIEKPSHGGGSSSGGSGGSGGGGGSASTTVQKPTVTTGEGGKTSLSSNGSALTITPDAGYEISKVTLNGTDKGAVSSLTGLKTGDKVTVEFAKKADNVVKVTYKDVAGSDWFNDPVKYVTEKGLMSGTGDSLFSPNADTTRGMLMTILARMSGTDTAGSSPWYQKGLDWAVAKGISDGTAPEMLITREQLATMLYRYAGSPATTGSVNRFSDADQVSGYALNAVKWSVEKGVISGNGNAVTLDPKGYATRAQMATMMMRYCELPA